MKALILVGGYGTRLRPLTLTVPKPLVDFGDKPILCHQIEALAQAGVTEVILAIAYRPEVMKEAIADMEKTYNIKITISIEEEPLGTAGPIRLAKDLLTTDNSSGLFFVFNSDVICEYSLQNMIEFHKGHGKEGTIMVTRVKDPSKYGVIVDDEDNCIQQFVEKPQTFVSDKINAGLYLFNVSMIDRIEAKPTSIEREIFPKMATDKQLFNLDLQGYWMDIGQPKDYLTGSKLYLQSLKENHYEKLRHGPNIHGNVYVHPNAKVDPSAEIGPNVFVSDGCIIGKGVRIANSSILAGTHIKDYAYIEGSIIGWKNTIGRWVRIQGMTVTGEDVQIKDELFINGVFVLPHKGIAQSFPTQGQVIM